MTGIEIGLLIVVAICFGGALAIVIRRWLSS